MCYTYNVIIMTKNIEIKTVPADKFLKRLTGIMFKRKKIDYGILFKKVSSIHTFFCFQNIDVVMMDKNFNVLYIFNNLKPNRIIVKNKKVHYVLELPSNFIEENCINIGAILNLTNLQK